jgi:hypothetical protein
MQYVITEEQYRRVLTENFFERTETRLKNGYNELKSVINSVAQQMKMSFRFLLTYGAGINGIFEMVKNSMGNLSMDIGDANLNYLILSSISLIFFGYSDYRKIYKRVKSEGLEEPFKVAIRETANIKERLQVIINDIVKHPIYTAIDILSYTHLIFVLPLAELEFFNNPEQLEIAAEALIKSSFITVSGVVIKRFIESLKEKLSSKKSENGVYEPQDILQEPHSDIR